MITFLFKTFLFFLFFYMVYKAGAKALKFIFFPQSEREKEKLAVDLVQDPSCNTYIDKKRALQKNIRGSVFYFCSEECLKHYEETHK